MTLGCALCVHGVAALAVCPMLTECCAVTIASMAVTDECVGVRDVTARGLCPVRHGRTCWPAVIVVQSAKERVSGHGEERRGCTATTVHGTCCCYSPGFRVVFNISSRKSFSVRIR